MVKYEIRDTSHIIMRSCGTLVAAMTRANNHVDVILWSRISPLTRGTQVGSACARVCTRTGAHVRGCVLTRRNASVQKGDAEKCACGANGGECNATRAEPAAECSSEPNSERGSLSSLGYCAQKQERREEGGRKRGSAGNGPRREPPGALYHRGCETRCRSAPCRRYDPPSNRSVWDAEDTLYFALYLGNTGGSNAKCIWILKSVSRVQRKVTYS